MPKQASEQTWFLSDVQHIHTHTKPSLCLTSNITAKVIDYQFPVSNNSPIDSYFCPEQPLSSNDDGSSKVNLLIGREPITGT